MKRHGDHHRLAKVYEDWHWGEKAQVIFEHKDPQFPAAMVECGRLVELHVQGQPKIRLPKKSLIASYVVFDAKSPLRPLYLILDRATRVQARKHFWHASSPSYLLKTVAKAVGGRQVRRSYPSVRVQPIGKLDAVVYQTKKKGDYQKGKKIPEYIHHFGEVSGVKPHLCVDSRGRLWIVGGNYTTPTPGITD